jgi:hypothetical protein
VPHQLKCHALNPMKHTLVITCAVCMGLLCASCRWAPETSFFSDFSTRKLVERNKPSSVSCDPGTGGGGGVGGGFGGFGSGGARFNSHKSDSWGCRLGPDELIDEAALFSAIKLDVEGALHDSGATITDRGSSGSANFYFAYTIKDVRGRVELTGTKIGTQYYDVRADLKESRN